jgi:hypothetical protein
LLHQSCNVASHAEFWFFDVCGHLVSLHTARIEDGAIIGFCGRARRVHDDVEACMQHTCFTLLLLEQLSARNYVGIALDA